MKIEVTRARCARNTSDGSEHDIDNGLQQKLQKLVNAGATIISVQQTCIEHVQPNNPCTYALWAEFLIVSITA